MKTEFWHPEIDMNQLQSNWHELWYWHAFCTFGVMSPVQVLASFGRVVHVVGVGVVP